MFGKSKILVGESWYDEIDPETFYETHLEGTILSKTEEVFPGYWSAPMKLKITTTEGETSTPDFILIKKDYSEWIIVEVEMSRHSWEGHVEKQVKVFTKGVYEADKISKYLVEKNSIFDYASLFYMIQNVTNKVLVIVNEKMKEWEKKIKKYNAFISVFQIYKGTESTDIHRVEGELPITIRDKCHCQIVRSLHNTLEVYSCDFLNQPDGTEIEIIYSGKKTKWIKKDGNRKIYLVIKGTFWLPQEYSYVLYETESNEYHLRTK